MKRLILLVLFAGCASTGTRNDEAILRANIQQYTDAVNSMEGEKAVALFAGDITLTYPGIPDSDLATLSEHYLNLRRDTPPGTTVRTRPDIEEVLISGDLAVIRLTWNTTVTDASGEKKRQMRDLQVWRREAGGTWKFARGIHFRVPPP